MLTLASQACVMFISSGIFAHAGDKGGLQKVPYLPEQCMLGKGGVFTPS